MLSRIKRLNQIIHKHKKLSINGHRISMNQLSKKPIIATYADLLLTGRNGCFIEYIPNNIKNDFIIKDYTHNHRDVVTNREICWNDSNKEILEWMNKNNLKYEINLHKHNLTQYFDSDNKFLRDWLDENNYKYDIQKDGLFKLRDKIEYYSAIMFININDNEKIDSELIKLYDEIETIFFLPSSVDNSLIPKLIL